MSFVRTPPGADAIVVEAHLPASPSQVFAAWTDAEIVVQWFGAQAGNLASTAIDLHPGGSWRFVENESGDAWTGFEGQYVQIVPDQRLVFTWAKVVVSETGERTATTSSQVEIRFLAADGGTDMTITHTNLDGIGRDQFPFGWEAGIANLVRLFE